jgi:hypothetical protein
MDLSYADVTQLFDYDYENGGLIYRTNRKGAGSNKIGQSAGTIQTNKYRMVMINRKRYLIHRLVWLWHNPNMSDKDVIGHLDGNKDNNRIDNLICRRSDSIPNNSDNSDNSNNPSDLPDCFMVA